MKRFALLFTVALLPLVSLASVPGRLRVSSTNPRWMCTVNDTTRAVFLAGDHTWLSFQDAGRAASQAVVPIFNWSGWLTATSTNGWNLTRFYAWHTAWRGPWTAETDYRYGQTPYKRLGGTNALDGAPKFNLDSLDLSFLGRLKARIDTLNGRNCYVLVEPFNAWGVQQKGQASDPFLGSPWNSANNTQGAGFTSGNGANTCLVPADGGNATIWAAQVRFLKRLIDTLHTCDNVIFGCANEPDGGSSINWMRAVIDTTRNYERRTYGYNHLTQIGVQYPSGDDAALWSSLTHSNAASPASDYASSAYTDTSKLLFTDTDHICGNCNDGTWVYKSFLMGASAVLFMDGWDGRNSEGVGPTGGGWDSSSTSWVSARKALGHTARVAKWVNLMHFRPQTSLASTGYCLRGDTSWIVYVSSGTFTVNVSAYSGALYPTWVNASTGDTTHGASFTGGASNKSLTAPGGNNILVLTPTSYAIDNHYIPSTGPTVAKYIYVRIKANG